MTHTGIETLKNLDLGSVIAEQDGLLTKCFVSHPVLNDIVIDKVDLILGAKGAGKSALWKELTVNASKYPPVSTVSWYTVTNPNGDPEFRDVLAAISAEHFPDADDLRVSWRLYLLSQFWKAAKPLLFDVTWIGKFERRMKQYGLIASARSNSKQQFAYAIAKVAALKKVELKWKEGFALEFSDSALKAGGSITSIPFNDLFIELNNKLMSDNRRVWLILDRLDEIVLGDEVRENIVLKGLLLAYRDISSYSNLRAKIFLRDDVYSRVTSLGHAPALSHVNARASRPIEWSIDDLLVLVVRRLLENSVINEIVQRYSLDESNSEGRRKIFYLFFPQLIDKGRAAEAFKWICDRISDGRDIITPRDLISVIEAARIEQIRQTQRESVTLPGELLFTEDAIRRAVRIVAGENLRVRIYAEYPDLRPIIEKFAGYKADHNDSTLQALLGDSWSDIVTRLERVGFIYRRERSGLKMWTVPFFYSLALDIKRGANFDMDGNQDDSNEDT